MKPSHQGKELPMSSDISEANPSQKHHDEELESEEMETRTGKENEEDGETKMKNILEFTEQEAQDAIDSLKKESAGDSNGIKAEDIKTFDEETRRLIREIFNEVLRQEDKSPLRHREE